MEHLENLVKAKTGITDEQAKAAVQIVIDQLKKKFPTILHHELDKVAAGGDFGDAAREKFEGLRDKAEEAAKQVGVKAEAFAGEIRDKFNELFGPKRNS
ncbi:MAG: hypothetical protein IPG90_20410 [Bacteroidetes bacterium]|nr:hypothetical protein [Bacteroidota bacterium]MBP6403537.1 hypothetical protein [Bacteroidia bacterium]MBK6840369.1 hypothetical protein [Bacteroidota bacterium]MBK9524085.1 hypothetical protein [Bacteroidota bacterium]MBK9541826.1 hypothetical protein [Bacteroidota bacterium]